MLLTQLNLTINHNTNRQQIRRDLINAFISESPGTGKGSLSTNYIYYVETLTNGNRIYISRPAILNFGFDFKIHVENMTFINAKGNSTRNAPSHYPIFQDLIIKKQNNLNNYRILFGLIDDLFNCRNLVISNHQNLFNIGYSVDLILGVIKWFFFEQDITYWNYSGRNMFMNGIVRP